jgi:acylphosphatase
MEHNGESSQNLSDGLRILRTVSDKTTQDFMQVVAEGDEEQLEVAKQELRDTNLVLLQSLSAILSKYY